MSYQSCLPYGSVHFQYLSKKEKVKEAGCWLFWKTDGKELSGYLRPVKDGKMLQLLNNNRVPAGDAVKLFLGWYEHTCTKNLAHFTNCCCIFSSFQSHVRHEKETNQHWRCGQQSPLCFDANHFIITVFIKRQKWQQRSTLSSTWNQNMANKIQWFKKQTVIRLQDPLKVQHKYL